MLDPLARLKDARARGVIPGRVYELVARRFPLAVEGINRIERASGIQYPMAYVEPSAVITAADPRSYQFGILFARTIPVTFDGGFQVVIQVSAPLVAYGLKGTIHAILAHEFLHFLDLARKISRMDVLSDEVTGSLFESAYADGTRLLDPRAVFDDRTLLRHITKRFPAGFRDRRLEDKAVRLWIDRGLPKTNVALDSNTVRLSAESLSKIRIGPGFMKRLAELEEKSGRLRKRRLY